MKSAKLVLAVAIATLGFSSLSFAESSYWRGPLVPQTEYRVGTPIPAQRVYDNRSNGNRVYDNRGYGNRPVDNRSYDNRAYGNRVYDNRGYDNRDNRYESRAPQWRRGGYVPAEYRGRQYQVNDWRARQLPAPAAGQQWVQDGTNFALIAIATGLIANLVLN
jgi:Ni/Co efflux regulator RcnB